MRLGCIEMGSKLNARHIEVAKGMIKIGPRTLFGMQWQDLHGFGVGNFPSLVRAGLVLQFDVGDIYGRKKYCISPNAVDILKEIEGHQVA